MRFRRFVTVCLAAVALLLATGCERSDNQGLSSEADEPNYRQGQQLVKQGRSQEALSAFLKVIAKRGESAPESHLEAGLLYLQQIKDPLAAIYHFRKYLELQPNSRQAVYVKGQIDVAKREFARTLPAAPTENQAGLDLLDKVDRLQRENDDLKAEVMALRGGGAMPSTRTRAALNESSASQRSQPDQPLRPFISPASEPSLNEGSPVSLAPETPSEISESPVTRPALPQAQPVRAAPTKPTAPAAAGGRRHVVVKGDTLFSLAQKYYGNRSRWRDIYAANRDVLPSENSLRIGMEVKIP
mgnify:CR=1 FL=1